MVDVPLSCNSCWSKLENKAYKTSCDHCFCESCVDACFGNRNRRCASCNHEVTSILEFQVVGTPILDDQLVDVRATLQAIACANGAGFLDSWITGYHRFERNQLILWGSRQGSLSNQALAQAAEREKDLSDREVQARQMVLSLEHENEQLRKEKESFQRGVADLQSALDERSRQAENWRAMYEALKNGGRVSMPPTPQQHQQSSLQSSASLRKQLRPAEPETSLYQQPQHLPTRQQQQQFENFRYEDNNSRNNANKELAYSRSREFNSEPGSPLPPQGFQFNGGGPPSHMQTPTLNHSAPTPATASNLRSNLFGGMAASSSRPATRDSLTSLLNRSVAPRTSSFSTSSLSRSGTVPDQVRSSFFAPNSLRAMSPQVQQSRRGGLSQGGMMF